MGNCATIVPQLGPRSEPHGHAPFNIWSYSTTFRRPPAVAGARYKDVTVYGSQFAIPNLHRCQQSSLWRYHFTVFCSNTARCFLSVAARSSVLRRTTSISLLNWGSHLHVLNCWEREREREVLTLFPTTSRCLVSSDWHRVRVSYLAIAS